MILVLGVCEERERREGVLTLVLVAVEMEEREGVVTHALWTIKSLQRR